MGRESKGVLVWSRLTRRSYDIAKRLNIGLFHFSDRPPYIRAWFETSRLFRRIGNKSCVIVQLPPGPAVFRTTMISNRPRLVCDCHTGMFYYRHWKDYVLNRPFRRFLSKCDFVLVHNPESKDLLSRFIGSSSNIEVVYDPIPVTNNIERPNIDFGFDRFILLPVAWEADENIKVVIESFLKSGLCHHNIGLVITGDYKKNYKYYKKIINIINKLSKNKDVMKNIVFTGFIPYRQYMWLIEKSMAVIALTNWEYTLLSVIWEAAKFHKPIIYPNTNSFISIMNLIDRKTSSLMFVKDNPQSLSKVLTNLLKEYKVIRHLGYQISLKLQMFSANSMKKLRAICDTLSYSVL